MTIGERIKAVRQFEGNGKKALSMEAFGASLGVTKAAISLIESDKNALSNQMATAVCRVYGVDEVWLRTGEGEMFTDRERPVVEEISAFLADVIADKPGNVRQRLVYALAKLTDDQWDALDKMLDQMIEDMKKAAPD